MGSAWRDVGLLGFLGVSFWFAACAEDLQAESEPQPVDDAELAQRGEELALGLSLADEFREVPGAAVALVDGRGVLWSGGFGYADVSARRRVTGDTAFWLASVSKVVTGTALVHAEEHGLLSLDTDVRALLASRAGFSLAAPGSAPISLRALVSHTSPIRDTPFYYCSYYLDQGRGQHETLFKTWGARLAPELVAQGFACDEAATIDLGGFLQSYLSADGAYYTADNFSEEPGPAYSNVGAALAGYALGLKTGVSLADYSRANLFAPLRMEHTSWQRRGFRDAELATQYLWDEEQATYVALPQYDLATWPDGALRSSARDMGRFLAMVMRGGELDGRRVLRERSVARMLTPLVSAEASETAVFWQLGHDSAGQRVIGHDGSDPGATTFLFYLPERQLGFVLLLNADTAHALEVLDPDIGSTLLEAAARLHARRR